MLNYRWWSTQLMLVNKWKPWGAATQRREEVMPRRLIVQPLFPTQSVELYSQSVYPIVIYLTHSLIDARCTGQKVDKQLSEQTIIKTPIGTHHWLITGLLLGRGNNQGRGNMGRARTIRILQQIIRSKGRDEWYPNQSFIQNQRYLCTRS